MTATHRDLNPQKEMEILGVTGRADVAEVFVARFRGPDGPVLEFVDGLDTRYTREQKWIINVSTQFGCPVGCVFCDAGGDFKGNLTKAELLEQVATVALRHPGLPRICGKLKVHFARMGEPSLNDAVIEAMRALPEMPELEGAPGLWCCVPSVAPKGREDWFKRLRDMKNECYPGRFQLQFSCNSTEEDERRRLMPIRLCSLDEVAAIGLDFFEPGDRKPVLNFALAEEVRFDMAGIADRFDPAVFAIKLTPLNPTARGDANGLKTILRSEREGRLAEAMDGLRERGYEVIISIGDGREDEVGSNCGQAVRAMGFSTDGLAAEKSEAGRV